MRWKAVGAHVDRRRHGRAQRGRSDVLDVGHVAQHPGPQAQPVPKQSTFVGQRQLIAGGRRAVVVVHAVGQELAGLLLEVDEVHGLCRYQ